MLNRIFLFWIFTFASLYATPLTEQFRRVGYLEICDKDHDEAAFDSLYASFDQLIDFFQKNSSWKKQFFLAKERFIRSKAREIYSTDFFGFYDESKKNGRGQISFYYSTHFDDFIGTYYPEFKKVPEMTHFFHRCRAIQKSYESLFSEAANELSVESIFSSNGGQPPILFKVIKYLPWYKATKPHYDGCALTLLLDSTQTQSLRLSPYKTSFTREDFLPPQRTQTSILLIPGTQLSDYSIYPTPHMVSQSGKTRYASVAFAMRPHYKSQAIDLSPLPRFND